MWSYMADIALHNGIVLTSICLLHFEARRKCRSHWFWLQTFGYIGVLITSKISIQSIYQGIVGLFILRNQTT